MPLCGSTHGGIAGHMSHGGSRQRAQAHVAAYSRRGVRRLAPGVPGTDDNDVEMLHDVVVPPLNERAQGPRAWFERPAHVLPTHSAVALTCRCKTARRYVAARPPTFVCRLSPPAPPLHPADPPGQTLPDADSAAARAARCNPACTRSSSSMWRMLVTAAVSRSRSLAPSASATAWRSSPKPAGVFMET